MIELLVLITFMILLPITPAYILYKALPAETTVEGPFKGLNIQLSGAFAGYFLLVLTILGFLAARPTPPTYQVWEVKGKIGCEQDAFLLNKRFLLTLRPPSQSVVEDGTFTIQVATTPGQAGEPKFPTLVIEHPDYQTTTIDLDEEQKSYGQARANVKIDKNAKSISVKEPITLKKNKAEPPYQTQGTPPPQENTGSQGAVQ